MGLWEHRGPFTHGDMQKGRGSGGDAGRGKTRSAEDEGQSTLAVVWRKDCREARGRLGEGVIVIIL